MMPTIASPFSDHLAEEPGDECLRMFLRDLQGLLSLDLPKPPDFNKRHLFRTIAQLDDRGLKDKFSEISQR
jgi:hypothetical protein